MKKERVAAMPFMVTWLKKADKLCSLLEADKVNTFRAIVAMFDTGLIRKGRKMAGRSYEFEFTEKGQDVGTKILSNIYLSLIFISTSIF